MIYSLLHLLMRESDENPLKGWVGHPISRLLGALQLTLRFPELPSGGKETRL